MNLLRVALDTETWFGEFIHIGIQVVIWQKMKAVVNKYFTDTKFHKQAVANTNDTTGRILYCLWASTQHSFTLFMSLIGYYSGNSALFRIGVTSEIAFTLIDSHSFIQTWKQRMEKDKILFIAVLFHHACDALSLVPMNIYIGDNIKYQRFVISMMAQLPFQCVLWIVTVTRNKNDLKERAQFAVVIFISILYFVYWRFYDAPY